MVWLAGVWIFFLGVTAIGGARIDAAENKPSWYIASGLVSGALCVLFVALTFELIAYDGPGTVLVLLAVAAGGWIICEGARDIVDVRREGVSNKTLLIAVSAAALLYLPAVGLGLSHGWRLMSG